MSPTLIDAVIDTMLQRLLPTAGVNGRVFEDRAAAYTREDAPAIEIRAREALATPLGDNHPVRSILQVQLRIDLCIYTRSALDNAGSEASVRALAAPIWLSAHSLLMQDPTLGGLAARLRWQGVRWERENADGTAGWTTHTYEAALAMRELNLQQPLGQSH